MSASVVRCHDDEPMRRDGTREHNNFLRPRDLSLKSMNPASNTVPKLRNQTPSFNNCGFPSGTQIVGEVAMSFTLNHGKLLRSLRGKSPDPHTAQQHDSRIRKHHSLEGSLGRNSPKGYNLTSLVRFSA